MPPATGKFTICAANRKAAANPSSGTRRAGSRRRTCRNASPTPAAESSAVVAAVFPSMNPSGMCMMICPLSLSGQMPRFNHSLSCGEPAFRLLPSHSCPRHSGPLPGILDSLLLPWDSLSSGPWSVVRGPSPGFVGALWEP